MQERSMISNMDLKVYLERLKNNPRFTKEMLQLVEEDLRFGLTPKETEEYTGRKFDYMQMKVYSKCLRNGYGKEIMDVVAREGLTGEQMAVALEFYEKGVPIGTVGEITGNAGQTAFTMKKLFRNVLEKLGEAQQKADTGEAYVKELLCRIEAVVKKIDFQERRYDALDERLRELQEAGGNAKMQEELLSQISEKDRMLESQQDQLNTARAEIARLRNGLDAAGEEDQVLGNKVTEMGRRKNSAETPDADAAGTAAADPEYRAVLLDRNGNIVRMLSVERMEKKKDRGIMTALLSRLCLKKKIDIVRLVAERGLEPGQLIQIRSAIEKGLTEKQLLVLIDSELPAGQMEEIINIAVYENKQKGGV